MKIIGNTVGTNMKRANFNQKDESKSDFILNNPFPDISEEDEGKFLCVVGGKWAIKALSRAEKVSL